MMALPMEGRGTSKLPALITGGHTRAQSRTQPLLRRDLCTGRSKNEMFLIHRINRVSDWELWERHKWPETWRTGGMTWESMGIVSSNASHYRLSEMACIGIIEDRVVQRRVGPKKSEITAKKLSFSWLNDISGLRLHFSVGLMSGPEERRMKRLSADINAMVFSMNRFITNYWLFA